MNAPGGRRPADVPGRRPGRPYGDLAVKIHSGCIFLWWIQTLKYFWRAAITLLLFSFFSWIFPFFFFFYFFSLCVSMFFLISVKTPAKSVWWAVWLGPRRGPWRWQIWGLRCRRHRVQTNSRGNSGFGTPFSVYPRGPSLPPGSPPAPSWHRSGSYPSNWQEKTQQALTPQALTAVGGWFLNWLHQLHWGAEPRVEAIPESGSTEHTERKSLWRSSRWTSSSFYIPVKQSWSSRAAACARYSAAVSIITQ